MRGCGGNVGKWRLCWGITILPGPSSYKTPNTKANPEAPDDRLLWKGPQITSSSQRCVRDCPIFLSKSLTCKASRLGTKKTSHVILLAHKPL